MKKTSTFLVIVFITCFCGLTNIAISQQTRAGDSAVLVSLYNTTTGANWTTKTNWLTSQPIDNWFGITVANNRVVSISLPNNNLSGGPLPNSLAVDSALQILNLSSNSLGGNLPYFTATSLVTLNLSNNQFFGTLNYYSLKNLQTLDLSNNNLSGSIASLSSYGKLITLNANNNQFDGGLPYFSDTSMVILNLSNNLLSGTINYYNLKNLQYLNFSNNQLTGGAGALSSFSKTTFIDASNNQFSGSAPYFGGNNNLVTLNLSHNQFTGGLPYFTNTALKTIDISYNQCTGTIGYYNTPAIINFRVDHNQLTGGLNFSIPPTLKLFTATSNKLNGSVVTSFAGLNTLKLDSNKFTFALAETVAAYTTPTILNYGNQDTILPLNYNTNVAGKLSVSAGGTLANNTYKWYNGLILVATIVNDSTYTPTSNGTYSVKITNTVAPLLTLTSATYNVNTVLPVELTLFAAKLTNTTAVQLQWQTANEINNQFFDIERSTNGVLFDKVGTVLSLAVNGNSVQANNYQFADDVSTLSGMIYYRLKQVDVNGKFQYSTTISLNLPKSIPAHVSLNMYPNPVVNKVNVTIGVDQPENISLRVVSAYGNIVYKTNKLWLQQGNNNLFIDFAKIASGIYTVEIINLVGNTNILSKKVVKY